MRDLTLAEPTSFDAMATVATLLSDRQLNEAFTRAGLLQMWRDSIYRFERSGIWALRFWGALSPVVRGRMLDGETLRFGSLTAAQKDALRMFVYLSDDRDYRTAIRPSDRGYGLDQQDADWLKSAWPGWSERSGLVDYEPTSQLPDGIPFDARIGMRQSIGNALEVRNDRGWSMTMTEPSAVTSGYYKNDRGTPWLVRPTKQHRRFFTVWLTPTLAKGLALSTYEKPTGEPRPYDQQAKELQERLEKAYKIRHGGGSPR